MSVPGEHLGKRATPSKRIKKVRVCAHEDCDTILSSYNPADHCVKHRDPRDAKFPGPNP